MSKKTISKKKFEADLLSLLPQEIQNFIKEELSDEKNTEIPLLTISQKDLNKYVKIKERCAAMLAMVAAIDSIIDEGKDEMSKWWEYIEDKHSLNGKHLTINPDTGLISEIIKKDDETITQKENNEKLN